MNSPQLFIISFEQVDCTIVNTNLHTSRGGFNDEVIYFDRLSYTWITALPSQCEYLFFCARFHDLFGNLGPLELER
jgi:hypothetical protein